MIHKPIQIKNLELSFPHKTCFEKFDAQIMYGRRIAIIGRNGSGKSTLLKIIGKICDPSSGVVIIPDDAVIGYVPQIIEDQSHLSGGERLNNSITKALSLHPNILLLDEPTNHLDQRNKKNLMRMLQFYSGTLIIVSHDTELLRHCIDVLWHIENEKIQVFSGHYDDYKRQVKLQRASIEHELQQLNRQKQEAHQKLMQEQERAAKSKNKGEKSIDQRKWPTIVSKSKASRSQKTSGRKKFLIDQKKQQLVKNLDKLYLPEIVIPKFSISHHDLSGRMVVHISDGEIGYAPNQKLLSNIHLSLSSKHRVAIIGDNGSGKSMLVKAILGDESIYKKGIWMMPKREEIGYLDQHYSTLDSDQSVFETISNLVPAWPDAEVRSFLNDFLFRKNEEVYAQVSTLSGGEKARLTLAQISIKPPKLLILDEITNNLDLFTKEHAAQILKVYPGAMMVISHDTDFLNEIEMDHTIDVSHFQNGDTDEYI